MLTLKEFSKNNFTVTPDNDTGAAVYFVLKDSKKYSRINNLLLIDKNK